MCCWTLGSTVTSTLIVSNCRCIFGAFPQHSVLLENTWAAQTEFPAFGLIAKVWGEQTSSFKVWSEKGGSKSHLLLQTSKWDGSIQYIWCSRYFVFWLGLPLQHDCLIIPSVYPGLSWMERLAMPCICYVASDLLLSLITTFFSWWRPFSPTTCPWMSNSNAISKILFFKPEKNFFLIRSKLHCW